MVPEVPLSCLLRAQAPRPAEEALASWHPREFFSLSPSLLNVPRVGRASSLCLGPGTNAHVGLLSSPQIPALERAQMDCGLLRAHPFDGKSVVSQKKKSRMKTSPPYLTPLKKWVLFINVCTYSFVYTYKVMCVQMNMVRGHTCMCVNVTVKG